MTITELIAELQKQLIEHGDAQVKIYEHCSIEDIKQLTFDPRHRANAVMLLAEIDEDYLT